MSRITDTGVRSITKYCWYLQYLNLEDIFLLHDSAFWYSHEYDGRQLADELMLKTLTNLNLSDCVHLTDKGIEGLTWRCFSIQQLRLKGCDRLTDESLKFLARKPMVEFDTPVYPTCDTIVSIDLSQCKGFTPAAVQEFLAQCPVMETIDLSGIVGLSDNHFHELCKACASVQHITLRRCILLTDNAMCSIADYLWLESLDISYCTRISDEGIEILTVACTGLLSLTMRRLSKLTAIAVNAVSRNCKVIKSLDIRECPLISEESVKELRRQHKFINIMC